MEKDIEDNKELLPDLDFGQKVEPPLVTPQVEVGLDDPVLDDDEEVVEEDKEPQTLPIKNKDLVAKRAKLREELNNARPNVVSTVVAHINNKLENSAYDLYVIVRLDANLLIEATPDIHKYAVSDQDNMIQEVAKLYIDAGYTVNRKYAERSSKLAYDILVNDADSEDTKH